MNDAGLCLAILEVFQVKDGVTGFDPEGLPYALCYRKILEECTTIDQAQKLLEGLRRTTTTNLVIADRDGVAVLEVTPAKVVRRQAAAGACACTNHFCTAPLRPDEVIDASRTLGRFDTLNAGLKGDGKLGPDDLRKQLDAVNLGGLTLQTMVFEPRTLKLHLAVGDTPASALPLRTIDLGPLFRGEGAR
jgi:predicted choloylglycine hydrolase